MLTRYYDITIHPRFEQLIVATTICALVVWLILAGVAVCVPAASPALARLAIPSVVAIGVAWVRRGQTSVGITLVPAVVAWLILELWMPSYTAFAVFFAGCVLSLAVPAPWRPLRRVCAGLALGLSLLAGTYVASALGTSPSLHRMLPPVLHFLLAGVTFGFIAAFGHIATEARCKSNAVERIVRATKHRGPLSPFAAQAVHLYRRIMDSLPRGAAGASLSETRQAVGKLVTQVLDLTRQSQDIGEDLAISDRDDLQRRRRAMEDAAAGTHDPAAKQHYMDSAAVLDVRLARLDEFSQRRERIDALCHHCICVLENLRLGLAQARLSGNAVGLEDVSAAMGRLTALLTELDCTAEALHELESHQAALRSSPAGPVAPAATA